jgi:hypothetical protein
MSNAYTSQDRAEVIARVVEDILVGKRIMTDRHRELVSYIADEINNITQDVIREFQPEG